MKALLGVIGAGILFTLLFATASVGTPPDTLVLSDSNTVSLNMPIDSDSARDVQVALMEKSAKLSRSSTIYLVLNSPGGSIDAGRQIIETAHGLPQRVDTISMFSASMSFITSQQLNTRYVMDSSTLMSHRATAGGVQGQIPGNLITRTMAILSSITELEQQVAARVKLDLPSYRKLIADELWLTGNAAVNTGFADKLVAVRCDASLQGPGKEQVIDLVFLKAKVVFHKCPLVTAPLSISIDSASNSEAKESLLQAVYDRPSFVRNYIRNERMYMLWQK